MPRQTYTEGEHVYENIGGQIYKNGRLIPLQNYQYIPQQIGGTRGLPFGDIAVVGGTVYQGGKPITAQQLPVQPTPAPQPTQPAQLPIQQPTYQQRAENILAQLEKRLTQPIDITKTPSYLPLTQLAEQRGKKAAQRALEELNRRGVLASTMAGYQVGQAQQQAEAEILPTLIREAYGLDRQQTQDLLNLFNVYSGLEQQEYERTLRAQQAEFDAEKRRMDSAWDRVKNIGYVDDEASIILGIPVGTMTSDARKAYEDRKLRLQLARENNAAALQRIQASNAAAMERVLAQQQLRGTDVSRLWSEYRSLSNLRGDPLKWANLPDRTKQIIEGRMTELEQQLGVQVGGGEADIFALIAEAKARGESDEEIARDLAEAGYDPTQYGLPAPSEVPGLIDVLTGRNVTPEERAQAIRDRLRRHLEGSGFYGVIP